MTGIIQNQNTDNTREAWLHSAIDVLRPRFAEIGMPLPAKIHVSVGFGFGAKRENATILGQCWAKRASSDSVNHIFIAPTEGDPAAMLVTLVHELIHAADDCVSGHRGTFAEAATRLGFNGPMTTTPPSVTLSAELAVLAAELGDFPHGALQPVPVREPAPSPAGGGPVLTLPPIHSGPGKQSTRMLKLVATECCGYTVRTTQRWLDEGVPKCPHGSDMHRV